MFNKYFLFPVLLMVLFLTGCNTVLQSPDPTVQAALEEVRLVDELKVLNPNPDRATEDTEEALEQLLLVEQPANQRCPFFFSSISEEGLYFDLEASEEAGEVRFEDMRICGLEYQGVKYSKVRLVADDIQIFLDGPYFRAEGTGIKIFEDSLDCENNLGVQEFALILEELNKQEFPENDPFNPFN